MDHFYTTNEPANELMAYNIYVQGYNWKGFPSFMKHKLKKLKILEKEKLCIADKRDVFVFQKQNE